MSGTAVIGAQWGDEGKGKVVGHEVLSSQLLIETEDRRRRLVPVADATVVPQAGPRTDTPRPSG